MPYATALEQAALPQKHNIVEGVKTILKLK